MGGDWSFDIETALAREQLMKDTIPARTPITIDRATLNNTVIIKRGSVILAILTDEELREIVQEATRPEREYNLADQLKRDGHTG